MIIEELIRQGVWSRTPEGKIDFGDMSVAQIVQVLQVASLDTDARTIQVMKKVREFKRAYGRTTPPCSDHVDEADCSPVQRLHSQPVDPNDILDSTILPTMKR